MEFVGAVDFAGPPRACNERHITRHRLAGRAARENLQKDAEVGGARDQFFDADDGDMQARQAGAQSDVAFIFQQHDGAGFGDGEVRARHAHLRRAEALTQSRAGDGGDLFGFVQVRGSQLFGEQRGDVTF